MLSVIEDPASVRDPLEGAGFVIVPEVVTRGQVSELIEETGSARTPGVKAFFVVATRSTASAT